MAEYYYKSAAPSIVIIVREYYAQRDAFHADLVAFGKLFGGAIAPMCDITSHYAGGAKISAGRALDAHWCRPDAYGYRSLRAAAKLAKGAPAHERAAAREEHRRLLTLWRENCPPRLRTRDYWHRLGVNTGHLLLSGGIKFEMDGTAYFHLGFEINEAEHQVNVAAGKPTAGWIDGASEIMPSEFQAVRIRRLNQK